MKRKKLLLIVILAALILVIISNLFTASLSPYLTVSELVERGEYGRNVQVIGEVDKETIAFDVKTGILTFVLTDGDARLKVKYEGIVSNLRNSTEVVVIGKYGQDGIFYAEKVLVKCPSKYMPKEEGG